MTAPRKRPTKAELRERELRAALSWPEGDAPVPMSEEEAKAFAKAAPGGKARAWTYNVSRGEVALGALDGNNHVMDGPFRRQDFSSRGLGGPWFRTRDDACLALRHDTTVEVAKRLNLLDERIALLRSRVLPPEAPESDEGPSASPAP